MEPLITLCHRALNACDHVLGYYNGTLVAEIGVWQLCMELGQFCSFFVSSCFDIKRSSKVWQGGTTATTAHYCHGPGWHARAFVDPLHCRYMVRASKNLYITLLCSFRAESWKYSPWLSGDFTVAVRCVLNVWMYSDRSRVHGSLYSWPQPFRMTRRP